MQGRAQAGGVDQTAVFTGSRDGRQAREELGLVHAVCHGPEVAVTAGHPTVVLQRTEIHCGRKGG